MQAVKHAYISDEFVHVQGSEGFGLRPKTLVLHVLGLSQYVGVLKGIRLNLRASSASPHTVHTQPQRDTSNGRHKWGLLGPAQEHQH